MVNYVVEPSFEEKGKNWNLTAFSHVTDEDKYSGKYSAKLIVGMASQDLPKHIWHLGYWYVRVRYKMVPEKGWSLRVYSGGAAAFQREPDGRWILFAGGNLIKDYEISDKPLRGNWREFYAKFYLTELGLEYARTSSNIVIDLIAATGEPVYCYIDDVYLSDSPPPPEVPVPLIALAGLAMLFGVAVLKLKRKI